MTITPLTKLQAVNRILAVIGEAPVTSLTDDFTDSQIAQERLDQESLIIQADGWHFNTDYEYTLTPDNSGNIIIPDSALSVFVPDYRKYIVRSNSGTRMLYDREEHTYAQLQAGQAHSIMIIKQDVSGAETKDPQNAQLARIVAKNPNDFVLSASGEGQSKEEYYLYRYCRQEENTEELAALPTSITR